MLNHTAGCEAQISEYDIGKDVNRDLNCLNKVGLASYCFPFDRFLGNFFQFVQVKCTKFPKVLFIMMIIIFILLFCLKEMVEMYFLSVYVKRKEKSTF